MSYRRAFVPAVAGIGVGLAVAGSALAADIELPKTLVWTAYNTGTSGYNQAVAIGSVLKNTYGVNLRVLPGKNDVSRLSPLKSGKAQFSATGSDSIYAQEAVYTFGTKAWGPQPIRLLLHNVADGCAVSFAMAKDTGVTTVPELKGKRISYVRGAPALNKAVEAMLAFYDMSWADVERVEVGGYGGSVNGLINGDLDALEGATFSTSMLKIQASPRGLIHPVFPHDDEEGWKRLNGVVPWYFRHNCMQGAAVPEGGFEGVGTAYPILISKPTVTDDVAYNVTKAMYEHYDDYKDGAPGANGWAWDRQKLEVVFLPFHEGAIRYYKEVGKWSDKAQANHENNLKRQKVIMDAWAAYTKSAPGDDDGFNNGWMKARADALKAANLPAVFETW